MVEAVDEMAALMKAKLVDKARQGYSGGLDRDYALRVERKLREHVDRLTVFCPHCSHGDDGDPVQAIDVANLAMMLWVQGGKPKE